MVGETRKASATDLGEDKFDLLLKLSVALDRRHDCEVPVVVFVPHAQRHCAELKCLRLHREEVSKV